jgi:hypothetical protein
MKSGTKHLEYTACAIGIVLSMLVGSTQAQQVQVPTPQTAAQVPGPVPGTALTKEFVQTVGRAAYVWGYPLVATYNRRVAFAKAPEPILFGGAVPMAPVGYLTMLNDYIKPDQDFIVCPNQDVVYGGGFAALDKEPTVIQVPDFGDRFWVYPLYDTRTDEIARIGKQYGSKPGFYMIVGRNWKGEVPAGITDLVRSPTDLMFAIPRIQMDDTAEDRKAIQPLINQVVMYPLSQFDGKMKTMDWSKIPSVPVPPGPPNKWVSQWVTPETYIDDLTAVMKEVPPLPGEEALYGQIAAVLGAAAKEPATKTALVESFGAADKELIKPFLQWRYNGIPAGNGWTTLTNGAEWGTDYVNRTADAVSNIYVNVPPEAKYFYNDNDSAGAQLDGDNLYAVTFAKGQVPPVKGFWSLTLYNDRHLFNANPLNARHEEQDAAIQRRRLAHALCGRNVSRQGKGDQLVAGTRWDVLALHPGLLGGESHPRRHLDATDYREGEVNKPISHRRETTMQSTFMHSLVASAVVGTIMVVQPAPGAAQDSSQSPLVSRTIAFPPF